MGSRIIGWGYEVPNRVVTNDDLADVCETSDEWIQKRTGIRERRYMDRPDGSVGLAETAVKQALDVAGIQAEDVDMIVCGSLSPDIDWPGNSSLLHERLGLAPKLAFDIRNQCSAFVYGVTLADQFIKAGDAKYVLVVGSEVHSTGLDFNGKRGRDVTVLFGDGAGAVVIGPCEEGRGLLDFTLHADGRYAEKLCCVGPGAMRKPRIDEETFHEDNTYAFPHMEGRQVFKHAVTGMSTAIRTVVERSGHSIEDLGILLPHQANLRINQFVALELELKEEQITNNIERYGNTTAATIPILLCETMEAGRIANGDLVCMAAFGAGFTWGATLYRW